MWVKRLLQALKETHTAVKYGFVLPHLCLSPRSPAERALSPVHGWQCHPHAPSWGGLWGPLVLRGSERPRCGGAEWQEWRRKMKTHKRGISGLELDMLARCAVPRKAAQPEIDVLLLMTGPRMETPGAFPWPRSAAAADGTSMALRYLFHCISCTLPGDRGVGTVRGIKHGVFLGHEAKQRLCCQPGRRELVPV